MARTWTQADYDEWKRTGTAGPQGADEDRYDPAMLAEAGDIFPILTPEDLIKWGFGNQSPDPTKGLTEWFPGSGFTNLKDFQMATQSLPWEFTDQGAVYTPEARVNPMDYVGTPDWRETAWPLMFALLAGGAAAGGLGGAGAAGAEGAAGAAVGGGAGGAGSSLAGLADFSLVPAGSGVGIGGVGTAGLGLNTAGIGLTPELIAAGGGAGAFGIGGGLGLDLGATGGLIGDTAANLATQGGVTLDSIPTSLTPPTTGPTGNSSIWSQLGKAIGLPDDISDNLGDIGQFGGSLLEWFQSRNNTNKLEDLLQQAIDRGDPFASQRPFYQGLLKDSYTDPNFFATNPVFKGLNDVAVNDASRVAASRGFNNSSNLLYDIADRVQKTGYNYANQFQGQLAQNAGAGISPGTSASIAAQGANQVNAANQQTNGALGATLANLPGLINGIKGLV